MKFAIKEWTLLKLYKRRNLINFPVFQRENVWFEKKKSLLVDSILRGIDIPKLYLQKTNGGWDCIDGHQRISAIVGFFDEEFEHDGRIFRSLNPDEEKTFENYKLTIAEITDVTDEEVRLLFIRLQLGVPLNSGEKLNAIRSNMGEFVKKMIRKSFMKRVSIPRRRFAKQQVCAQICNNSMFINKTGEFRNSKYQDLENLYRAYVDFDLASREARQMLSVLDRLDAIFGNDASEIRNRASIVSIYLMVEEMMVREQLDDKEGLLRKFYLDFLTRLKREVKLGMDATNRFLVSYQSRVIQAADSKSSIRDRHDKLREAFDYYVDNESILEYD